MSKVKGVFAYKKKKDDGENSKAKFKKALKKRDKLIKRQIMCNHIGRDDGKQHLVGYVEDGTGIKKLKCEICGQVLIADQKFLTPEAFELVSEQVATIIYAMQMNDNVKVNDNLQRELDTTLKCCKQFVSILEEFPTLSETKRKKNKKNKKNKKKKKTLRKVMM